MKVEQSDHAFLPVVHTLYYPLHTHTHAGNVKSAQRQQATHKCIAAAENSSASRERKKERAKTRVSFYYFSYIASSSTLTWSETVSCVRAVGCCGTLFSYSQLLSVIFAQSFFFPPCVVHVCAVP